MDLRKEDTLTRIIAVGIYTVAILVASGCAWAEKWPWQAVLVMWTTVIFSIALSALGKIPNKVFSYIFVGLGGLANIFISIYMKDFIVAFMMITGAFLLASFFHSRRLLIMQLVMNWVISFVAIIAFGRYDLLASSESVLRFIMMMFVQLGVWLILILNIGNEDRIRKELQDTAFEAEKAEHSKSEFLANMSHEIRTPMNAIIGMCELILREGSLSQTVMDHCHSIQTAGRSLLGIINDILDFSKIESGKVELAEEEFNIASTLNDVINMTTSRMADKNLELVVYVDPAIPRLLLGDENRIKQIILNLLTNAVKYTPEGVITIRVKQIIREYGINLQFSVKDTGIGITRENKEKLFNSFQRVDTKKNRNIEGTGLGLVITKRLITRMGGFIKVESEYGKGSEFSFVIPLHVKDRLPFITIKDADQINTLTFTDINKFDHEGVRVEYRKFINRIGDDMQIRNIVCKDIEDVKLRVESGNITHIFVDKEEFIRNRSYFEVISEKVCVVIIQSRQNPVSVPQNMRCIYKPIYAVPISDILNNEKTSAGFKEAKEDSISFTAPRARILIVDDNAVNLDVARGLMQPYKMQVLTADSAKAAIKMLGSRDYDLVFMDHMMPEMDGVEATKFIRNMDNEYFKKLPIIALTANAVSNAREMFMSNGFDGFLAKPIEISALDRTLKKHLPQDLLVKLTEEDMVGHKDESGNIEVSQDVGLKINVKSGLAHVGGSSSTYLDILNTYVTKGKEKLEAFTAMNKAQDWKNYIIEAHALKSSSLAIGAKDLSELAKSVELNGKAGDLNFVAEHHEKLMTVYKEILELAEKLLAENTVKEEAAEEDKPLDAIDKDQLTDIIKNIENACDSFDFDSVIEILKPRRKVCYGHMSLEKLFTDIVQAANDFDDDRIKELLGEIEAIMEQEGQE